MLKRHQILLTDWLVEYAIFISEKYDISFSESVRALMCAGIIESVKKLYPSFKPKYSIKGTVDILKKVSNIKARQELFHKYLSDIYFDTRKAVELRLSQEKKSKDKLARAKIKNQSK